jgi:putative Holliday junction resolvase
VTGDGEAARPRRGTGRVLALDLGSKRIGVAYSDSGQMLASPWGTIERRADASHHLQVILGAVRDLEVSTVVVGLPLHMSGDMGSAAKAAVREATAMREILEGIGVGVEIVDERLTTVEAERLLRASGRTGKEARRVIDAAAAMVLLQSWLDRSGGLVER